VRSRRALLDERAPRSAASANALRASANRGGGFQARCASSSRKGDAAELARRFFLGHGPASIQDLARWSSLTISQCRDALEAIRDQLHCVYVDGVELWCDPSAPHGWPLSGSSAATAVRRADLSYPLINFPQANGHPHAPGEDLFVGSVIIAETNARYLAAYGAGPEDDHGDWHPGVVARAHGCWSRPQRADWRALLERSWS
jgi:hypothetical protein